MYVDNAAMKLVMDPTFFDVMLTENMFGDILSDMGGAVSGSIGLLPSSSTGSKYSLYEPIHGSFPQGKGLNIANPIATILSLAMMLEDFGMEEAGAAVRAACALSIEKGVSTPDLVPGSKYGTIEVGDFIANAI
jgi:3-isopropylmalate dehydrogenase